MKQLPSTIAHNMRKACTCLLGALALLGTASCSDNTDEQTDNGEFTNKWTERNATYFSERLSEAKNSIAKAQATYGEAWEEHCQWRVFLSYSKSGGRSTDSICARIIERGEGTVFPLYTDSVKVNYMGHLIPTDSYKEGRVFDHSGVYENNSYVFSPNYSSPARFAVSNLVEGFTTALMHMHVNDRWMVYIPQELGYTSTANGVMPAYSTLCFDMQLKGFCRKGDTLD